MVKKTLLAVLITLLTAGNALAVTLFTPPCASEGDLYCDVLNTGKRPYTVVVDFVTYGGVVAQTSGPVTLAPGAGLAFQTLLDAAYCRIKATSPRFRVTRGMIRGTAVYNWDSGTNTYVYEAR